MKLPTNSRRSVVSLTYVDILSRLQNNIMAMEALPKNAILDMIIEQARHDLFSLYHFGYQELGLTREELCCHYASAKYFHGSFPTCEECNQSL